MPAPSLGRAPDAAQGPACDDALWPRRGRWRRLESWLWTGPLGHLVGGAADLAQALARYWLARARDARGR